jgi:hypothetical protein
MATFIPNVTDVFPQPKLYTPDFSFIDKMLKRKEAQYEQGFAQLNNQYNTINKAVTHDFYGKQRDKFLNDAKVNLKNLSAMDLSDPQNVREAVNVFKPIYSNTGLLADQALTSHWNSQLSAGESLRLKDGGKEYSEDNMNYIRLQMQAYKNDDPSTVNEYYGQKRSYNPYYDYNKEVQEAMKDFKPSHTKMEKINGMWMVTEEDKSYTQVEIAKYLNGVLSDKAKQQMRIEGAVRLGTNENFLMNEYVNTEGGKLPKIGELIDKIDAQLKVEKDPTMISQLKANKDYYEDERLEINNNLKSIRSGDMTFLKKNSEALSYKTYYDQIVTKKANAFSNVDISQTYGINEVAKMYWENQQDWAKIEYKENRADDRELKKLKAESMKGITEPISVEMAGESVSTDLASLTADLQQDIQNGNRAYDNLKDVIANANKVGRAEIQGEYGKKLWTDYITKNPNDKYVVAYLQSEEKTATTRNYMNTYKKDEDAYVLQQFGDANYKNLQMYKATVKKYRDKIALNQNAVKDGKAQYNFLIPEVEAAIELGLDNKLMTDLTNQEKILRKSFNSTERTISIKNQSGFTLGTDDPRTKAIMSKLGNFFKATDVIGGPEYFPSADGKNFSMRLLLSSDPNDSKKVNEAIAYAKRLQSVLGVGANPNVQNVTYNAQTHGIVLKGLGGKFAQELDPYNMIPANHRAALGSVENSNPPVSGHVSSPLLYMDDITGKRHFVTVIKYKPDDGDNSTYNINIDGTLIQGRHFDNTIGAYLTLQNMMASPFLNQSLKQ